jgi:hypothetical protein
VNLCKTLILIKIAMLIGAAGKKVKKMLAIDLVL